MAGLSIVRATLVVLLTIELIVISKGQIDVNVELQSEDIEPMGRQSDKIYKGVQSKKVGKKTYKCNFNIAYSLSPPKCTKSKAKCKPLPKKPITFTIDKVYVVLKVTVHKKKVTRCSIVAATIPTTQSPHLQTTEHPHFRTTKSPHLRTTRHPPFRTTQLRPLWTTQLPPPLQELNARVAKLESCLADVSSSDCPSSPSGKTGLAAALDDKCDCTETPTSHQGWTIIQRRGQYGNAEDYFNKDFNDYEIGFGSDVGELWIGLITLAALTSDGEWEMQVDLTDWDGKVYHARYNQFSIGPAPTYTLHLPGEGFVDERFEEGEVGDSALDNALYRHHGQDFSARDKDQDGNSFDCAGLYKGGWWYFGNFDDLGNNYHNTCKYASLNGLNFAEQTGDPSGIRWNYDGNRGKPFKSFKASVMKMRKVKV